MTQTNQSPDRPTKLARSHQPRAQALSRRDLLRGAAAAGAITVVPRHVLGGAGQTSPSAKPALAGVGIGGVGFGQLQGCDRAGFEIVALCDVDDVYADKAYKRWPKARKYRNYREMLEAEGGKIDSVYVGTPDHTHAVISMEALRKKKNVCCVKPLTRTIHENRTVVQEALDAQVATQVTASPNTSEKACRTCELIWAGAIGPVREVHIWSNRPLWPQGMLRPEGQEPVPSTLDWDLWIGPAPMRDFVSVWPEGHYAVRQIKARGTKGGGLRSVYHPWNFRGWWDFGTGALGDMGCHHINTPFRALQLTYPKRVHATATQVFEETAPLASIVTYDYPARDDMPPVRLVWYDGGIKPPCPKALGARPLPGSGEMYVGDEGVMLGSDIYPESRKKKFASVPKTLPRRSGTWGEWYEACTGGETAGCSFPWAGMLTEFVLLGNIAIREGRQLDYDADAMRFTNHEAANKYIQEPYRDGWTL